MSNFKGYKFLDQKLNIFVLFIVKSKLLRLSILKMKWLVVSLQKILKGVHTFYDTMSPPITHLIVNLKKQFEIFN